MYVYDNDGFRSCPLGGIPAGPEPDRKMSPGCLTQQFGCSLEVIATAAQSTANATAVRPRCMASFAPVRPGTQQLVNELSWALFPMNIFGSDRIYGICCSN